MPIYEYICKACGHQFEILQKITEAPLTECPECHKSSLNKLISETSFQLKGTGWYVTDIRDKGKPKPKEDGDSSASGTDGSTSSSKTTNESDKKEKNAKTNDAKSNDKAAG